MNLRNVVGLAAILVSGTSLRAAAEAGFAKLNVREAEALVRASLSRQALALPNLGIEPEGNAPSSDDWFMFQVLWDDLRGHGGTVETVAVDARTGDVWSAPVCRQITSAGLKRLQRRIRKSLGLTDAEYGRRRRKGPSCE